MFKFIKNIFKTKNNINIKQTITNDELIYFYQNRTKNYIWNDYIKLNKYEKVFAYSLKGINDIEIINSARNAYFNPNHYYKIGNLSKEMKVKIKNLGILLKDIRSLETNNSMILHHLIRFTQITNLPLSQYIRIVSLKLNTSPEIELELHNFVFHRDNKELYKFLPPNHPNDRSHVVCIRKKDFARYSISEIFTDFKTIHQHEDYDFCIGQYILEEYKRIAQGNFN